jgi:S-adenosylmethionine synthetase
MPAPISYAHKLSRRLAEVGAAVSSPSFGPTAKCQSRWNTTKRQCLRLSRHCRLHNEHSPDIAIECAAGAVIETVIKPVIAWRRF